MKGEWEGAKCPGCGCKGIHYAPHPHARGWKDYDKVVCRYCGKVFSVKSKEIIDAFDTAQAEAAMGWGFKHAP